MLVTLEEYAELNGVSFTSVRSAIYRGKIKPNVRENNRWYIEDSTPWISQKHPGHENLTDSKVYNTWRMMKQRCYNPKASGYSRYGGRGIKVCDEWRNNSKAFIDWAMSHGWKPGKQLDRIDNDGDYCPENCRIVTLKQNLKHRDRDRRKRKKQCRVAYFVSYREQKQAYEKQKSYESAKN